MHFSEYKNHVFIHSRYNIFRKPPNPNITSTIPATMASPTPLVDLQEATNTNSTFHQQHTKPSATSDLVGLTFTLCDLEGLYFQPTDNTSELPKSISALDKKPRWSPPSETYYTKTPELLSTPKTTRALSQVTKAKKVDLPQQPATRSITTPTMKTTIPAANSSRKAAQNKERILKEGQLRQERLETVIKTAGSENPAAINTGGKLRVAASFVRHGMASLAVSGVRTIGITGMAEGARAGKAEKRVKAHIEHGELKKDLEEEGVIVERVEEENGGDKQCKIEGEEGWEVMGLKDAE